MSRPVRHSGLQKQVLALYRRSLRAAAALQAPDARQQAFDYVRTEFRAKASSVNKLDVQRIEYLLRQGAKRLDMASMPGVTSFGGVGVGAGAGVGSNVPAIGAAAAPAAAAQSGTRTAIPTSQAAQGRQDSPGAGTAATPPSLR
jgi:succinate dehydrogenase assembly factor 1